MPSHPLTFRISSALKNIIGRELITDDFIAVFELVKNSFDAHATKVTITFDEDMIIIKDDGKGMTHDDLKNKWLFLAYSAKNIGTEDDDLNSEALKDYRNKIQQKRFYAGAKGIGRFSCDRLGNKLNLITRSAAINSSIEKLVVDWKDFEKDPTDEFINIKITHTNHEKAGYPSFRHGTILEISGLGSEWSRTKINDLKHSLEKLINPFEALDAIAPKKPAFSIEIKCDRELAEDKITTKARDRINGPVSNIVFETLNVKTTHILTKINENGDHIITEFVDRGTLIYKIQEENKSQRLKNITFHLFYLNRAAKASFKKQMGIDGVAFGSIFLYKNGFRVYPFGEEGKDTLRIDRRKAQGYSRYLGTRDLIGRIEIIDEEGLFKETSSRTGGLIETPLYDELVDSFWVCFKRLERYVVGVQWELKDLSETDKDSPDTSVLETPRAKALILEIVSRLSASEDVDLLEYNKDFLNIIESKLEEAEPKALKDLSRLAIKTDDAAFHAEILKAEKHIEKIFKERQEAEERAAAADEARREAEEKLKREKEKNTFLLATRRGVSKDAQGLIHNIKLVSSNIRATIAILLRRVAEGKITKEDLLQRLTDIKFSNEKAMKISELITRSNFKEQAAKQKIDLFKYVKQYIGIYGNIYEKTASNTPVEFEFHNDGSSFWTKVSVLELSIILDNLISNSIKAEAGRINVDMETGEEGDCILLFSDDGNGLARAYLKDPEQIFELGITSTVGGSGIGLYTARKALKNMKGDIRFMGNGLVLKGASFKITFGEITNG